MLQTTPILERIPQVWFLLGLLFVATGLYLGFEFSLSFWYMAIGSFCCAFSIAILVLRRGERPRAKAEGGTRESIEFASAEPGHAELEYAEPAHAEPAHAEPAHATSKNIHEPVMQQPGSK